MSKQRKKKALFAQSADGKLYVQLCALMNPIIAMCDGLPITIFGKEKTPYIDVDSAIEWCIKEHASTKNAKYTMMIEGMEKAKAQVAGTPA